MDTFNSQLRLRLYSIDNIKVHVILPLFLWTVGKAQSAITCYNEATTTNKQIEKQKAQWSKGTHRGTKKQATESKKIEVRDGECWRIDPTLSIYYKHLVENTLA